jgi:hypothetical protein
MSVEMETIIDPQRVERREFLLKSAKKTLTLVESQRRLGVFADAEATMLSKHIVAGSAAAIIQRELNPSIGRLAEKLRQIAADVKAGG